MIGRCFLLPLAKLGKTVCGRRAFWVGRSTAGVKVMIGYKSSDLLVMGER